MAKLQSEQVLPGTCFMALNQTAGKGQRGRSWIGNKGENIAMSLCLQPFHREFPFLFSASVALGCYDFIKECGIDHIALKWPNDVYIGDRKAAGILIENVFQGQDWRWSVAGIGINVNQQDFEGLSTKATSLRTATGRTFDIIASAKTLRRHILNRLDLMHTLDAAAIMDAYNQVLYGRQQKKRARQGTALFTTRILRAEPSGELVTTDSIERRFAVGDIEFL